MSPTMFFKSNVKYANMDQLNQTPGNELTTQQELDHAARLSTRKKFIITIGIALVLILGVWI